MTVARRALALCTAALLAAGTLAAPTRASAAGTAAGPGTNAGADTSAGAGTGKAARAWVVRAQSGPTATLRLDAAGALTLAISRAGRTVVEPSPLGIVTDQVDLSTGLTFRGRSDRWIVDRYRTTVGKRLDRTATFREATYRFAGTGGAQVHVVVRASRDGIAYRYVLPRDYGDVLREASAFVLPTDAPAWLALYRRDYENPYVQTTAGGAATAEYMHPALFESGGSYALLTESDVDGRYSGGRLVKDGSAYRVRLWDEKVTVTGPLATPWRTAIVGDLATVSTSTLVDDLAPRSQVRDTSWIRPGAVFWSWLAGGREAGQSLTTQKRYVDYAAAHGWPYALVDAGWYFDPNWDYDPTWETTSWIPELIRYANARKVRILLWIHFNELDTAEERASRLALFQRWGAAGLKIDFMDSDAQERFAWYDQILPETAAHRLTVNFHGSTLPHGIHRTWPHVMTMEGVHGGEKSSNLTTSHLTALPFTRNVPGSMDYTPMAWHRPNRPTSDAHELALSVLFESGQQNYAGRVDGYTSRPQAERYLDQVPTAWDETRMLAGRPADHAVFARRSGDRWFLGGGYSGAPRVAPVPLDLPRGRWLVELVGDGPNGLVRTAQVLSGGDVFTVNVVAGGGFAGIACRWRTGLTTCDQPVSGVPRSAVAVRPGRVSVKPGEPFTVAGTFTPEVPVSAVTLNPRVPTGWAVAGPAVTAGNLGAGQSLTGTWVVTPPADVAGGYRDVPIVAAFVHGARLESEGTIAVHTWRPLPAGWSYLSDRDWLSATNGDGPVERDRTNGGAPAGDGRGIAVRQATYGKGLGAHASGEVSFALDGACTAFAADVGVDDEAGLDVARQRVGGTVAFTVLGDGVVLAESGPVGVRTPARALAADLTGVRTVALRVSDGDDGTQNDHASWGDARIHCQ